MNPTPVQIQRIAPAKFVAVADELNFSRAAERLYLSQPALSRQIRMLERLIGCDVFHRNRQRVELTLAGEALFGLWNPVNLLDYLLVTQIDSLPTAATVVKTQFLVIAAVGVYLLSREYATHRRELVTDQSSFELRPGSPNGQP
ncbi:LysR family transcriptional regulator, partial [Kibdelosporangium lantanae]